MDRDDWGFPTCEWAEAMVAKYAPAGTQLHIADPREIKGSFAFGFDIYWLRAEGWEVLLHEIAHLRLGHTGAQRGRAQEQAAWDEARRLAAEIGEPWDGLIEQWAMRHGTQ